MAANTRDHSRFILDALSPKEQEAIRRARTFKASFDELLSEVRQLSGGTIHSYKPITARAAELAKELKGFKLSLLARHLRKAIKINLSPTFISHMVNELEEYERILTCLLEEKSPPVLHELHHHLLWLQDAYGHAGAIHDDLDAVEKKLRERSHLYTRHFEEFYLKAVELAGYLRTKQFAFPALKRFNLETELEIKAFQGFLAELLEMDISAQALGHFSALMADHMFREECYYLTKLAESTHGISPDCDPARPRVRKE